MGDAALRAQLARARLAGVAAVGAELQRAAALVEGVRVARAEAGDAPARPSDPVQADAQGRGGPAHAGAERRPLGRDLDQHRVGLREPQGDRHHALVGRRAAQRHAVVELLHHLDRPGANDRPEVLGRDHALGDLHEPVADDAVGEPRADTGEDGRPGARHVQVERVQPHRHPHAPAIERDRRGGNRSHARSLPHARANRCTCSRIGHRGLPGCLQKVAICWGKWCARKGTS
jgi:hypothetical protein